ncbi:MAG TPA: hypothetical protein PLU87_11225 [Sedimentisphaerales bacterium]|nr:hypothetical protein [Sedimentisphaerales bacterium]HRS12015.1 hypothetical protein [Sedimentisphaerales bacterium]HRV50007.1 hypothetical protein [Sedimentisphaerales bacterium]
MRGLPLLHFVLLLCAFAGSSCASLAWSSEFEPGVQTGIVRSPLIREVSGIAASRKNADVLWVHNDSGDAPRVYAIDTHGNLLGICPIVGALARDWEDIAVGPGPDPNEQYLYIGDIGDNLAAYPSVRVYRVPEPDLGAIQPFGEIPIGPAQTIELTYPDGPRDAETLLVDPLTQDIYVITKRDLFCKVYRAAAPHSSVRPNPMTRVAVLPWGFAVAGDVSPDGRRIIVRSPYNASMWLRADGEPLWKAFQGKYTGIPVMSELQGEGLCFDGNGLGYYTLGEKANPPLHYFACSVPRRD